MGIIALLSATTKLCGLVLLLIYIKTKHNI